MKLSYLASLLPLIFTGIAYAQEPQELLNVSYDPTRELYEAYNAKFAADWKTKTGKDIKITQSHGGSGKQGRAVIDGLQADVVTLALAYDIDTIAEKRKLLPVDWQSKLPYNSAPYTSTIVFLVRSGNPKHIKDWGDLAQDGVQVITPNPKTSGGARWNYLAAWAYADKKNGGNDSAIMAYMKKLFANVPVLDTGARGSTTTFAQRNMGDVLVTWENEAYMAMKEMGKDKFEIVYPSISMLAEPPVAVITKNTERKGTTELANAYLQGLYEPASQRLIAQYFYRPNDPAILAENKAAFPAISMVSIASFGGWKEAQKKHFDDGGTFDQIYTKK